MRGISLDLAAQASYPQIDGAIEVGSTRQARFSEKPAQWIFQQLEKRGRLAPGTGLESPRGFGESQQSV